MATKKERAEVELIINGQQANASIRNLEAASRKAKAELRGLLPGTAEFDRATANLKRIDSQLQKTRVEAGLAKSAFAKMKQEITTSFIGNLGANLATLGLQKFTGYFVDAYDNAVKLSDQFADIRKTTGMTADEVLRLNKELGKINTRTSMSDLREIAKVGGQFGVAKEQILGFVQAVDRTTIALGDEFGGGAEQVATEMSKLRNILQDIKSDDVGTDIGFISNAINALASAGVATGPVVADLANRIGGYGSQIGLTSGEILGLSATLQELGVTAERGGTAVVKILQKMLTNSGDFARIAGMELGEFEKLLNTDIYGAFVKVMEGSKNMGQSSTLLAGIIDSLGVEGAGASEVFAKLGSNTELLQQKVDLAGNSLTNLNSITEEARLRNDNLAGSAERLGKTWNKFMANPALQGFFQWFIDQISTTIQGMDAFASRIGYNYDIITKGKAEADRIYLENQKKLHQEQEQAEQASMLSRVQGYKNGLNQMKQSQLEAEQAKMQALYKGDLDYARQLTASGRNAEAALAIQTAKETSLQLKAVNEILAAKNSANTSTLSGKRELTEKEIKLEQKKQDEIKKIDEKAAKERLAFEEARLKQEYDAWKTTMYQQIEDMKTLDEMAASLLEDDADRYLKHLEWEQEMDALHTTEKLEKEKQANQERQRMMLQQADEVANIMAQTAMALMDKKSVEDRNELARLKKQNDAERQSLKEKLDAGLITKEEYAKKEDALNQQEAAKEKQMRQAEAEREKKFRLFLLTIEMLYQVALAAISLGLDPVQNARAIAAGVQLGVVAATPLPEFYEGGYTGKQRGAGIDGKGGFKAILHPDEYVINKEKMQDPYVAAFANMLETNKANSTSLPAMSMAPVQVKTDPKLLQVLERLESKGVKGVWDWDYETRTKERMAELDNRRKL